MINLNFPLCLLLSLFVFHAAYASKVTESWPGYWIAYEREQLSEYSEYLEDAYWIWTENRRGVPHERMASAQEANFRYEFAIDRREALSTAVAYITADHQLALSLNGHPILENPDWNTISHLDLLPYIKSGTNTLTVKVINRKIHAEDIRSRAVNNPAGLIANILLEYVDGSTESIVTDESWEVENIRLNRWDRASTSSFTGIEKWKEIDAYSNQWYCYRKTFEWNSTPEKAIARIAVDSKYWLWINGEMVVFEGGAKRGPTPDDTYYDELDLSPYLKSGENTFAILAWYWGRDGFSHNDSGHHGLYFDLASTEGKSVISDSSWKVSKHTAFKNSYAPYPNYRLPEFNVHFDARDDLGDWYSEDFSDHHWNYAVELGHPPIAPWNQLYDRLIPQWKDIGLVDYEDAPELPFTTTEDTVLELSLPYNAQVTPYFKIRSEAGKLIDMRMDNYVGGSEQSIRSEYVTRHGLQAFETPAWMNGHKVQYRFPRGIEILDLKYRETSFDAEILGSFTSDNAQLNELWKRSMRTLLVCMRDTYYDCPDRERAQWWGDAVIQLGQTFYTLDRGVDSLTKKAIRELVNWQRPDHTLYSPIPSAKWYSELPGQMLMSIGYYGFWTYYFYSGDIETIEYAYPHLRKYLELWEMDADGLVENRQGEWYWGDWGINKDTRILDNCYYYMALKGAKLMAQVIGIDEDVRFYETRMDSIKQNFDRIFWQGSYYRSPDHKGETDDRGHGLAVVAGIANPDNYAAIATFLESNYHASPYVEKYILEALIQMGYVEQAIDRMLNRYSTHLAEDITTLFEGWGIGNAGFGGGTINHSWSGGPLTLMSQYIAGIEPIEAGFKRFQIRPRPGSLKQISADVPSPYGKIAIDLKLQEDSIMQMVEIPSNTIAELSLPIPDGKRAQKIFINNREESSAELELGTGHYRISAELIDH